MVARMYFFCFQTHSVNQEGFGSNTRTDMTSLRCLVSCGVGNVVHELFDAVVMPFALVYFMKVAELPSDQAGLIMVSGHVSTFIANPTFGFCCDNIDVWFLSRKLGRRKSWHLIGTIVTLAFLLLTFSPCFVCLVHSSLTLKFMYYWFVFIIASFWFGAVTIGHSSLVPEIAKTPQESVMVNSIRYVDTKCHECSFSASDLTKYQRYFSFTFQGTLAKGGRGTTAIFKKSGILVVPFTVKSSGSGTAA